MTRGASDPDVVVVGAGVVGAATAWALARRGVRVAVLEQFAPANPWGASHGRARIYRTAYPDAGYLRLARAALPRWRELEQVTGVGVLTLTGGVDHGERAATATLAAALTAAGEPHEMLSAAQARDRWPGLAFTGDVLHHDHAGRLDAEAAVRALLAAAVAHGAQVVGQSAVMRVEVHGDHDVRLVTGTATVRARQVVIAAGAWTAELAGGSPGLRLPPIRVTQEQPALFTPVHPGSWPTVIHHAARSTDGVYGVAGPEGVKVGRHGVGRVVAPRDRRRDAALLDDAELTWLQAYARRYLPGVEPDRGVTAQTCTYASTPDAHFVIDRVGPITVAAGFSGHGFKFGPVLGELVWHLVGRDAGGRPQASELPAELLEAAAHRFRARR